MSRWSYPTETVTVGKNSQDVRGMTAKQRREFAGLSKRIASGEVESAQIPEFVVQWGAVNPPLSMEDVQDMPAELIDACRETIMKLTGFSDEDEKKEVTLDSAPTILPAAE